MIRSASKLLRTTLTVATATTNKPSLFIPSLRFFNHPINAPDATPVALQMIKYALSLANSHNSVAAMEALVGLNLALGNDDSSSVLADKSFDLWGNDEDEFVSARAIAVKGLIELVRGNVELAASIFQGFLYRERCIGTAALSFGEFLHATRNLSLAETFYQNVVDEVTRKKDFTDMDDFSACNMSPNELQLAAICALGQLEGHMGKFNDAEETLTKALDKAEKLFGSHHPNVGVVLTCLALMFRHKAVQEHSSSLLMQEGLYRKALDLLKAPPLDSEGNIRMKDSRKDILALARGGYGDVLSVQQNRKNEGERMKRWAEEAWRNRRLSLEETLQISESSTKMPVIDVRTCRVL